MINITAKVLALSFLSMTCFAADENPLEENTSVSSGSSQEKSCQKDLLKSGVIWERFPLGSPRLFQDLHQSHQLAKIPNHKSIKQKTWENALHWNQVALKEIVSNHWYSQENLFQLIELIVHMTLQGSPIAKEILCDFSRKFKHGEITMVLEDVTNGVANQDESSCQILLALIYHGSLEAFAPSAFNGTILSFLTEKALDEKTIDFTSQVKLLEAYRDGHYGIKKNYKKNKRCGYDLMLKFALEADNPGAQSILLRAYNEGSFGIKKNDYRRKKEARTYLSQFANTTDKKSSEVNFVVQEALREGWFDLVPVSTITLEDVSSSSQTLLTVTQRKEAFFNSLVESATKTVHKSLEKSKRPMATLKTNLNKIIRYGFDGFNNGFNKNNKLALLVLKSLAVDYKSFPAQTLLIHTYHDGLLGIKKRNRTQEREALKYMDLFAPNNHQVQMLHLKTFTEGWFNIDPTDWQNQSHARSLAESYAFQGNRRAQEFLIDIYDQGKLGTFKHKDRHQKALFYRKKFNIYPESSLQNRGNIFAILIALD